MNELGSIAKRVTPRAVVGKSDLGMQTIPTEKINGTSVTSARAAPSAAACDVLDIVAGGCWQPPRQPAVRRGRNARRRPVRGPPDG